VNPIFSSDLAMTFGCPIIMADVKSARASKNFAMKENQSHHSEEVDKEQQRCEY